MAELARLESVCAGDCTVGSNPTLSAGPGLSFVLQVIEKGAGEVREWLNRPVSKTGIPFGVSRVRIPPSPLRYVLNNELGLRPLE